MNNYVKELMMFAQEAVGKVFILADKISKLAGQVFESEVEEMQFNPDTLSYIFAVGNMEYNITMNLNDMSVNVNVRNANLNVIVAYCHIGVNGDFKAEYGRGFSGIKDKVIELFDMIEGIQPNALQEEFESEENMSMGQDIEVVPDDEE